LLDLESVFMEGREHPTQPGRALEEGQLAVGLQLDHPMGGGQARNAGANHGKTSFRWGAFGHVQYVGR
jgi:hypothetical protein